MPKTATGFSVKPTTFDSLLDQVRHDRPELSFIEGPRFAWHAGKQTISFQKTDNTERNTWALLHEVGHALLGHSGYRYDIELLKFETAAWHKACQLAATYGLHIDDEHIQDCLDTYRDWLHVRATCPTCLARSLQTSPQAYQCFNCGSTWMVSRSRLCRPYRLRAGI